MLHHIKKVSDVIDGIIKLDEEISWNGFVPFRDFLGHDKSFGAHVAGITSRSLKIGPFHDRKRTFILEVVDCYF
jgi:hypothetical protein